MCTFNAHTKLVRTTHCYEHSTFLFHTDGSPSLSDQCPKIRTGSFGACIFKCSDDDDCQLGQICCSNGCGQACICPPDKPLVNCFVDPCDVTICPAHPDAMCQADYCGGCNARFLDSDGDEVTETCNRMF